MGAVCGCWKTCPRILIVGLAGAGKTSLYNQFLSGTQGEAEAIAPVDGFAVESFQYKNITITAFDIVPGEEGNKQKEQWKPYLKNVTGIIFVVDASAPDQLDLARAELDRFLATEGVNSAAPLLVYANKSDIEGGISASDLVPRLGLIEIEAQGRKWKTSPSNGARRNDPDTMNGFGWLADASMAAGATLPKQSTCCI